MKKYTLGEWLEEWFTVYKKPVLKPYSCRNIESVIRLHVPNELKSMKLSKIRAFDVERALAPLGNSRMRVYTRQVLFSALDKAFKLDLVERNVIEAVEKTRYRKKTGKALSLSEQEAFINALSESRYKYLMLFYLLSGVRRNEALSILWNDIDPVARIIRIRGTKTASSDRSIPLTDEIVDVLNAQRVQNDQEAGLRARGHYHQAPADQVFPFASQQVSREFKRLCPAHHLHELRHTFITRCAESGINVNVCQQLVGHSSADMTLNVYTHVMDDFKKREAAKFRLFPNV